MMHTKAIDLMIPIDKYPHVLHTSTVKEVAETIHAHPTLAEIMLEAAFKADDRSLHG